MVADRDGAAPERRGWTGALPAEEPRPPARARLANTARRSLNALLDRGGPHRTELGPTPAGPVPAGPVAAAPVPEHPRSSWNLFDARTYDERWFEVDGLRLHYEIHGNGDRPLVFLHAVLLDAQMNRRLADDLAAQGNTVVLLDLPGHGKSDKPRHASAHRMDSYAHYVGALLDELGLQEAVVGGVSLGANVSLQFATRSPERVRGLLLEMPVLEWAVPGAAMAFIPLLLGVHYAAPLVRLVSTVAKHLPKTRIGPVDSFVSTLMLEPDEAAAVLHGLLVGPITPTYAERRHLDVPALVIGHKADVIHPFTDADHLSRQLPNARLIEAHSVAELRLFPRRLTRQIATFLEDTWEPKGPRRHEPRARTQRPAVAFEPPADPTTGASAS